MTDNTNHHEAARIAAENTPRYQHLLERHARLLALVDETLGKAGDDYISPTERAKVESELDVVAAELAAIEQEHWSRIVAAEAAAKAKAKVREDRRAYAKAKAEGTLPPPTPQTPIADVGGFDNNGNPL